jgi:ribosomal protein S18 acetylase RimI-like enzyme
VELGIAIRGYRAGDAAAMFRLDEVCFDERFRFSVRAMRRFAEARNALVWVAEEDGELAGFAIAHVKAGWAYLVTLDVAPAWRRRGVAGELVERVEHAAGVEVVWLHVLVENEAAIRFYEGRGYERVGVAEGFYGSGLDGWVYRLSPSSP